MEKVDCEICEAGKVLGYTKKPPLQREQVEGEFTSSFSIYGNERKKGFREGFRKYLIKTLSLNKA